MSFYTMDLVSDIKAGAPTGVVMSSNPLDRPIEGRSGVTVGQHLDEFNSFRDEYGRTFDELVYCLLHGEDAKMSVEDFGTYMRADRARQTHKRLIGRINKNASLTRECKDDDSKIGVSRRTIDDNGDKKREPHVIEITGGRKKPGVRPYKRVR
ncbi:hypothetical protein P153DRAFT_184233 [Dothidotthia symphoricarpi CBS 119687]|uniref:Uncharacterized protein n=1 Tax=Dothidotthia symphoricarpi CBS 119687 TaxID=1392245 RepID=A0A6A6AKK6_9PLEO|nr:uncharacterized protein P153DRAFT_184233 [Dothidotthia symphoricarpi CBS 119687]KAF2132096.1 hypothetical protein P153DRAFT_184233 [Dothidotthia symphoricarpi CBS 119687]